MPTWSSSRRLALAHALGLLVACEYRIVDDDEARVIGPSSRFTTDERPRSCIHACAREERSTCVDTPPPTSCTVAVDRWKELLVIHRSVLLDERARNDVDDAPWSFRSQMEALAGRASDAATFTSRWLDQYATLAAVGPDRAPVVPRPGVDAALLRPWQAGGGSIETVPFRLIAIVHRPDLREEDSGCRGGGGELRFVYTATDATTGRSIAMTAIVEIPYPSTRSAREWIDAWHALGALPFGASYNEALATLTSRMRRESRPETWRVRTNEIAFGGREGLPWELREFALSSAARLEQVPLAMTPRIELDRSRSFDTWATDNEAAIREGSYVLPSGFQAGAAPVTRSDFRWSSQALGAELRSTFGMATCNGCHGGERRESRLRFQHIAARDQPMGDYASPEDDSETRLSSWLNDPSTKDDELARRERSMARALCGTCAAAKGRPSTDYPR